MVIVFGGFLLGLHRRGQRIYRTTGYIQWIHFFQRITIVVIRQAEVGFRHAGNHLREGHRNFLMMNVMSVMVMIVLSMILRRC